MKNLNNCSSKPCGSTEAASSEPNAVAAQAASRRIASSLIGVGSAENRAPVRWRSMNPRGRAPGRPCRRNKARTARLLLEPALRVLSHVDPIGRRAGLAEQQRQLLLHPRVKAVGRRDPRGRAPATPAPRSTRRASTSSRRQPRMPPNTWISMMASKLAFANGSRSPSACTRRGARAPSAARRFELGQHAERKGRRRHSRRGPRRTECRSARCRRRRSSSRGDGASTTSSTAARIASGTPSGKAR